MHPAGTVNKTGNGIVLANCTSYNYAAFALRKMCIDHAILHSHERDSVQRQTIECPPHGTLKGHCI